MKNSRNQYCSLASKSVVSNTNILVCPAAPRPVCAGKAAEHGLCALAPPPAWGTSIKLLDPGLCSHPRSGPASRSYISCSLSLFTFLCKSLK